MGWLNDGMRNDGIMEWLNDDLKEPWNYGIIESRNLEIMKKFNDETTE